MATPVDNKDKCPDGMVYISARSESPFCINKTEVTQADDQAFWAERQKSGFVVRKKSRLERVIAGPRKPAVLRTWDEAREYCQTRYRGGDLPTGRQWDVACGDKQYCTASGTLKKREAIFDAKGPADVGSTHANANGVQDMTGNVWEWTLDKWEQELDNRWEQGTVFRVVRGGSWDDVYSGGTAASVREVVHSGISDPYIGFRCVSVPLVPK